MVPDAISLNKQVPVESFDVEVRVRVPDLDDAIAGVREARAEADKAQRRARESTAELVAKLRADGLSLRDVAEVLGISYQRVRVAASDPRPGFARTGSRTGP